MKLALGVFVNRESEESVLEAIKYREASSQPLRKGSEEAFRKSFAAGKSLTL